jgi:peptidoglycan/LPS O-acetylase OafA/YrhL
MRAVAVLVLLAHLIDYVVPRRVPETWLMGQLGVHIFFVHTSLVLMQSLERSRKTGSRLVVDFYVRRAFRIYPLAIVCVIAAYVANVSFSKGTLLANLILVQNLVRADNMISVLWTLPLEVQMYAILPLYFTVLRNRHWGWSLAVWVATVGVASLNPTDRLSVLWYAPCFAGVIAWRLQKVCVKRAAAWMWPLGMAAVSVVWLQIDPISRQWEMSVRWLFCLCLGVTIPMFNDLEARWLTAPSKLVARYSYGIYLSHIGVLVLCFVWLSGYSLWLQWTLCLILLLALPVALYHLIEEPMISIGRRLLSQGPNTATAAVPAKPNFEAWGDSKVASG